MTLKAEATTTKIDKLKTCVSDETNKKMKRQPVEWEKRFVDHTSDKGLVLRILELLQLSYRQVTLLKYKQRSPGWEVAWGRASSCTLKGCRSDPWLRCLWEATDLCSSSHIDVFLSSPHPPSFSLKLIIKNVLGFIDSRI